MPGFDPNLDTATSAVHDVMANESLRTASAVFEHRATAQGHRLNIQDLTPEDVQQIEMYGQLGWATPAFGKLIVNAGHRVMAFRHETAAARISNQLSD